jgi:dihydrofolate reductase
MRRLSVFNQISLDGYFRRLDGDVSWTHSLDDDDEFNAFVNDNASGGGPLLFGRTTYEMMAGFWPTPQAAQRFPELAKRMNALPKIVASRTLRAAAWSNTSLIQGDLLEHVRKLKREPGEPITILGSGSIVAQLAQAGLIDEYQVVMFPLVLGAGKTMFDGVQTTLPLTLMKTRTFSNGKAYLVYEPKR